MNRRKRPDARQLAREKILFRYSSALERGEFDVIAAILREAEHDPILEQMLWEMNQVYRAEMPGVPAQALPSLHLSTNHNHRTMREDESMTTYTGALNRPARANYSRWMPLTLVAAVMALALFGAALVSLGGRDPQQDNMAALQAGSDTPTLAPSPTATPFPTTMLPVDATSVPVEYVIQAGDTLVSILARFNISIAQFASVNPEINYDGCDMSSSGGGGDCRVTLFVGQKVRLPFADVSDSAVTVVPTFETNNLGTNAACQGVITGSPQAEVLSVPSFDASQFVIVGRVPAGAAVSVLQYQPPNDTAFPTTAWYFISWEADGAYVMGWIEEALVEISGECAGINADPCQVGVSPSAATPTFTPTPAQNIGETEGGDKPQNTALTPTIVPPGSSCIHTPTATPFDFVPHVPGATPTAGFDAALRYGGYDLMTTEQVGEIPAGTRVRVGSAYYDGSQWVYTITANNWKTSAQAHESQLTYVPGVTPGIIPPTIVYGDVLGVGSYSLTTTEAVGDIPAGTYVRAWSAWWNGETWVYQISDEKGQTAEAREDQLTPAPDVTMGAPTPPGVLFTVQGYNLVLLQDVGNIPAGTLVRASSGYYDGREWVYGVTTEDGRYADVRESQLGLAGLLTPSFTPTPASSFHADLTTPTMWPT